MADARTSQTERAVAAQPDDFRLLIDASHDAIVTMDARGRVVDWNRRAEDLFGWTRAEAEGRLVAEFLVPPELQARHTAGWQRRLASPRIGPLGSYELPALRRDGSRFIAEVSLSLMRAGTLFAAFFRDITTQVSERQVRLELKRANELIELVIKNTGLAVATFDLDGSFQTANERTTEILGYTRDELIGMPMTELLPPADVRRVTTAFAMSNANTPVSRRDVTVVPKGRGRRELSFGLTPLVEAGGVVGFVGVAEDITDQRRTQESIASSEKLASLASLAGGVAHDFNNLLTTILGNVAVIRALPRDDPSVSEALDDIETAGRQAADLAQQMLAYAGKTAPSVEDVNVSQLVTSIEPLLRAVLPRNVRIVIESMDDVCPVHADLTQLRQVILNVATNASEAIGQAPGCVTLSTGMAELDEEALGTCLGGEGALPGRYAYIQVTDDGPGMTPEVRQRIFDPFYSTRFAGRGLGLSAVFGIVRAHHGALSVASEPGAGASFTAYLPVRSPAA